MEYYSEDQRNDYSKGIETEQRKIFEQEFKRLGCKVQTLGSLLCASLAGKRCILFQTETSFTSRTAARLLSDKTASRELFRMIGVNHAYGYTFDFRDKRQALTKLDELGTAVIKPSHGRKGFGVAVNVTREMFDDAWEMAARFSKQIILESCFQNGVEARYFVINGRCVAIHSRLPPSVVGDGVKTIEQLVDRRNVRRLKCNPSRRRADLILDRHRINLLAAKGLTIQSVPAEGVRVIIDWKAGISTGGDAENITDFVHPSMKQTAERIAQSVPGLDVIGVDILARDHRHPAAEDNYIVIEANTRPGTRGHLFPDFGKPINVCRMVAKNCVRLLKELPSNFIAPQHGA